jgi:nucleotide-binding universal stress UspA family protein
MKEKANKKPILVPVDFSSHAEAALVHAAKIADCLEVPVIVLHVVHDPGTMPGYYARASKKKFLVHIEDAAREMLDEFLAAARHKEPELKALKAAHSALVLGLPVSRILEVAKKEDAAMIIMGSKGETGLKHLLVGSIAEQVVHLAPIPVTIVKKGSSG